MGKNGCKVILLLTVLLCFIGCGFKSITYPNIDDKVRDEKSKEEWVWEEEKSLPSSLSFSLNEDDKKVEVYLNESLERTLGNEDSFTVFSLRKTISVKIEENIYRVFLDSEEVGRFVLKKVE